MAPLSVFELGGAGILDLTSPAFSAKVFRLPAGVGSGTAILVSAQCCISVGIFRIRPDALFLVGTKDGGIARELLSAADNS